LVSNVLAGGDGFYVLAVYSTCMLWFLGSVEAIIRNYKRRLKRLSAASGEGLSSAPPSAPPTGAQRILALESEELYL